MREGVEGGEGAREGGRGGKDHVMVSRMTQHLSFSMFQSADQRATSRLK